PHLEQRRLRRRGRGGFPSRLPGACAAALVGTLICRGRASLGLGPSGAIGLSPLGLSLPWPTLGWLGALPETLPYLSIALPFALVTIIGALRNTQRAAPAAGGCRARAPLLAQRGATVPGGGW